MSNLQKIKEALPYLLKFLLENKNQNCQISLKIIGVLKNDFANNDEIQRQIVKIMDNQKVPP